MDQVFTPGFWKSQFDLFVWWLRGAIFEGQIEALKARLLDAQEKERDLRADLSDALVQLSAIQNSFVGDLRNAEWLDFLQASIKSSAAAVQKASSTNNDLRKALSRAWVEEILKRPNDYWELQVGKALDD